MIVGEVIAVVACVAAVVSAYHDGNQLFDVIKKKWKKHRHPPALASDTSSTDLEWSLRRGREDILTEWNAHTNRLGRHFEDGDPLAREQMKDIVIELQSALLANLRENNADFDLLALVQASDRGRIKTITVFHNLYQRLTQAAPIPPPISFGPVPIDPASRLFYWINLIENQYLAQLPPSRYTQNRSSFPGARVLAGGSSSPQLDMLNFIRQVEEQAVLPQSRRSSGSRASFGSLLSGRRRSSVEAYSPRGESSSHFGSFGSGAGLTPMPEIPNHCMFVEMPSEDSHSSAAPYATHRRDYIEQDQNNRINQTRLQQNIQREQAQQEMQDYALPTEVPSRQHNTAPSSSGGDDMDYDPLTLEMTANPWIMDAGRTTAAPSRIDMGPSDMEWTRTYTPEPIPEPATRMHPLRTNIVDSRYLLGMETPWAEEFGLTENLEQPRPAIMDSGIEPRGFIPQLRLEETIRREHYSSPSPHFPPSSRNRPTPQPGRPPQTNLRDPPTPGSTGTSPPTRTPISRPTHTPSISSTNSGTSSTSSDPPPRNCWPPSNDNNYAGFCKGAWKFSSGLGGFKVYSEPKGYYSMVSKWRCTTSNCFFEMPLADSRRTDPKISTEVITHHSTGIQYRWAFLAKSHMKCKRSPTGGLKEPNGPFGCIFCCRERGGPVKALEGLDAFIRHLLVHRDCGEGALLERARCVVGRVAGVEEDFDVNIPPLEMESS